MSARPKPLMPARMAVDAIEEIKGFVSTLLYARDIDTRGAIIKCLFEEDPIIKGPFIQIRLPFRSTSKKWPLDKNLEFKEYPPHEHQFQSFLRLRYSTAENTLVTTGTGSGKSECFILPILDYVLQCKRTNKINGVKALVMYPMNALIEDQGERLSEIANDLNRSLPSNQHIRIGRYTAGEGITKAHDPENPRAVIDHRETLCENPPDVLLTNYRMLDFMLARPQEQKFWAADTKDVFKYTVLDELHTFDGAQGADVACLIRRLRLKLDKPFVSVGTSATIASAKGIDSVTALCDFATTLFGDHFDKSSVITEDRLTEKEVLSASQITTVPAKAARHHDMIVNGKEAYSEYVKDICTNWEAPVDQKDLAKWIHKHELTAKILRSRPGTTLQALAVALNLSEELAREYLDLLGFSRNETGYAALPLSAQIWTQAVPFLLRKLSDQPSFIRPKNDSTVNSGSDVYLPAINCSNCGLSGWLTHLTKDDISDTYQVNDVIAQIRSLFAKDQQAWFVFPALDIQGDQPVYHVKPSDRKIYRNKDDAEGGFPVILAAQSKDTARAFRNNHGAHLTTCPACESSGSMSTSFFGNSMIGSVLTGSFLTSAANPTDRKFLIFNDSVQDAAHQAGYLSARGFKFNFRRFLLKHIEDQEKHQTSTELLTKVTATVTNLWNSTAKNGEKSRTAISDLMQIVPKDLWERWHLNSSQSVFRFPNNLAELIDRLNWETWAELTMQSELGWSLRKTTLVALEPKAELVESWKTVVKSILADKSDWQKLGDLDSFVYGLIRRFIVQGAIYREDLNICYANKKYSLWPLRNAKPHLASLFFPREPKVLSIAEQVISASKYRPPIEFLVGRNVKQTWFGRWAQKHGMKSESSTISQFYDKLIKTIHSRNLGLKCPNSESPEVFVLDADQFEVHWKKTKLMRCQTCTHLAAVAVTLEKLNCTQIFCNGQMIEAVQQSQKEEQDRFLNYMGRQYKRPLSSIFAHPHTGQLDADDRRKVEQAFKMSLLPGDSFSPSGGKPYYGDHPINVLTCTPTMEMGIDIGTLSGVALRSFPRTIANTLQRLGRSGRSSGNAFNAILTELKPHDLYFWNSPKEFFEGSVAPPGCQFRNSQMLVRQFNAYCFDVFAGLNPELRIPKTNEIASEDKILNQAFWVEFLAFLRKTASTLVPAFISAIKLGDIESSEFDYAGFKKFLDGYLKDEIFAKAVAEDLSDIDRARSKSVKTEVAEQKIEKELNKLDVGSLSDDEARTARSKAENLLLKRTKAAAFKKISEKSEYVLKRLADKGYLPNYAFPEEGVQFDYSVRMPSDPKAGNFKDKWRFKQKSLSRPPMRALRELAPGCSYYTDGFKVPVTRIGGYDDKLKYDNFIACSACGSLSKIDLGKSTREAGQCPICREEDQPVTKVVDLKNVTGSAHFSDAQIQDGEELRQSSKAIVEIFVNYEELDKQSSIKRGSQQTTWVSPKNRLALEFKTNAEIHHLNRNLAIAQEEPKLFEVCKDCGAIPYGKVSGVSSFRNHGINRHAPSCERFQTPDDSPTEKIAVGRHLVSDTIRFRADNREAIPTMMATLGLAMKTYLKGYPSHLVIVSSQIRAEENGFQHMVTLYDNVPGGTGHLRSLMIFKNEDIEKSSEGLKRLQSVLEEVKAVLQSCACEDGCYQCLYDANNQYQHDKISRTQAIQWLSRFTAAGDWEQRKEALSLVITQESVFDSAAEEDFATTLLRRPSPIEGVTEIRKISEANQPTYDVVAKSITKKTTIVHTAFNTVTLNASSTYTKPDFTITKAGEDAGYLYIDGREFHLNPGKAISTFENQDVKLRSELRNQSTVPVLTFSYDMIKAWDKNPRLTRFKNANGQDAPVILLALIHFFNPEKPTDLDSSEHKAEILQLYSSFVNWQLAKALGTVTGEYLTNWRVLLYDQLFQVLKDGAKFGGLTFDKSNKRFAMVAGSTRRLNEAGDVREEFKISWELFWILWTIDPELVHLAKKQTATGAA